MLAQVHRIAGRLALGGALALGCKPGATAVAPSPPSRGSGFVDIAPATTPSAPTQRPWRDALRGERLAVRVPDHAPVRGAAQPLVTIVQFGDYTDARSAAQAHALAQALERWPDEVRIAFVDLPSAVRPMSRVAAQTAAAAGSVDKFWAVHDRLFAEPPKDMAELERIATAAGLDIPAWKQAIADHVHEPWLRSNVEAARASGVARAGVVLVNGRTPPTDPQALVAFIDEERTATAALVQQGLPRAEIYAEILAVADAPSPLGAGAPAGTLDPSLNYAVPAAGRPVLGPVDARVTIIVFSDFQCPFCRRVQTTLAELRKEHPKDVRFVFRNHPLAFHAQARELARLALAADLHGKFWPMHDLIFEGPTPAGGWQKLAKKLRLNPKQIAREMALPAIEQKIAEDEADAAAFGANGTPTFFINGRILSGAQPTPEFERIIAEELIKAEAFAAADPGGEGTFYDRLIEGFEPSPGPPIPK